MNSELDVIVRIYKNSERKLTMDQSVSINDILEEIKLQDKNVIVKINGIIQKNYYMQLGQFKSSSSIVIEIDSHNQNENNGKMINVIINVYNGKQINQSKYQIPDYEQLRLIQDRVYEIIGIYNEARKQLSVDLFINQQPYGGPKLERTLSDNNIQNNTVIDAKLRWSGGRK